jgi:hypothetical protein
MIVRGIRLKAGRIPLTITGGPAARMRLTRADGEPADLGTFARAYSA